MLHLYLPGQSLTQPRLRPPGPLPVPQMPLLMKKGDRGLWTDYGPGRWHGPRLCGLRMRAFTHTHTHTGLLNTIFTSVISVPEHTAFFCLFNLVLFFPVTEMLVAACCACGRAGVGGGEGGKKNNNKIKHKKITWKNF